MTFEEKAFKDGVYNTKFHCPEDFGYEEKSECTCKYSCEECWNREYSMTIKPEYQHFMNRFMEVV